MVDQSPHMNPLPILYSFRRCPYAMRARLGIYYSGIEVELREVVLRDKPASMIGYSPKGTVPVLIQTDGTVIDESIDIVRWALDVSDPHKMVTTFSEDQLPAINSLIDENDSEFKGWLDRYKYADRHPDFPVSYYREKGELFVKKLETLLQQSNYLFSSSISIADIAIAPFIRQFAHVDKTWFDNSGYPEVRTWLTAIIESVAFKHIFKKYPQWKSGDQATILSSTSN